MQDDLDYIKRISVPVADWMEELTSADRAEIFAAEATQRDFITGINCMVSAVNSLPGGWGEVEVAQRRYGATAGCENIVISKITFDYGAKASLKDVILQQIAETKHDLLQLVGPADIGTSSLRDFYDSPAYWGSDGW